MTKMSLEDALQAIVREHGFEQVVTCLHKLQVPPVSVDMECQCKCREEIHTTKKRKRDKANTTAPQYVGKMALPFEKQQLLEKAARKFEEKSFLPTFSDIANFCQVYQIDTPASRTRASAVPRVFKFIASMETNNVRAMLDDGMFSGPSRLGPIADAIRQSGRHRNAGPISQPIGEE